jgi:hypothetical protein
MILYAIAFFLFLLVLANELEARIFEIEIAAA